MTAVALQPNRLGPRRIYPGRSDLGRAGTSRAGLSRAEDLQEGGHLRRRQRLDRRACGLVVKRLRTSGQTTADQWSNDCGPVVKRLRTSGQTTADQSG